MLRWWLMMVSKNVNLFQPIQEDSLRQLIFFSLAGFAVKDGGKSIIKTCRCVSLAKLWFAQPSQPLTVAFAEVIYARFVLNVRSTQWAALPALVGNYQKNMHRLFPTDIDTFVVQHWGTQKRTHIWVNDFPIGPRTPVTASGCPHSLQWRQSTVGSHAIKLIRHWGFRLVSFTVDSISGWFCESSNAILMETVSWHGNSTSTISSRFSHWISRNLPWISYSYLTTYRR